MKKTMICMLSVFVLTGLASPILSAEGEAPKPIKGSLTRESDIDRIKDKLKRIEKKYIAVINYNERREAIKEVDEIFVLLDKLGSRTQNGSAAKPMSKTAFLDFFYTVKNEPFKDRQFVLIEASAKNSRFFMDQLTELLQFFPFDDDKIRAIKIVYPVLVDKENTYKLYDLLTHGGSVQELQEYFESFEQ